jgi:hypothetical protein
MTSQCRGEFGPGARMCSSQEILESDTNNLNAIPTDGCWIRTVFQPFQNGGTNSLALDASGFIERDPKDLTCLGWSVVTSQFKGLVLQMNGSISNLSCESPPLGGPLQTYASPRA